MCGKLMPVIVGHRLDDRRSVCATAGRAAPYPGYACAIDTWMVSESSSLAKSIVRSMVSFVSPGRPMMKSP